MGLVVELLGLLEHAGAYVYRLLLRGLPARRALGRIASSLGECQIVLRSQEPVPAAQYFQARSPMLQGKPLYDPPWSYSNIPELYAVSDVRAAGDVFSALARVRKSSFRVVAAADAWEQWSIDTITVGGSYKAASILDTCLDHLVVLEKQSFRMLASGRAYVNTRDGYDYGLIYKGRYPQTHHVCFVIMGLGVVGTEAAAHFMREHLSLLGQMFGGRSFAVVIRVRVHDGKEAGELWDFAPEPSSRTKINRFWPWLRHFKRVQPRRLAAESAAGISKPGGSLQIVPGLVGPPTGSNLDGPTGPR